MASLNDSQFGKVEDFMNNGLQIAPADYGSMDAEAEGSNKLSAEQDGYDPNAASKGVYQRTALVDQSLQGGAATMQVPPQAQIMGEGIGTALFGGFSAPEPQPTPQKPDYTPSPLFA